METLVFCVCFLLFLLLLFRERSRISSVCQHKPRNTCRAGTANSSAGMRAGGKQAHLRVTSCSRSVINGLAGSEAALKAPTARSTICNQGQPTCLLGLPTSPNSNSFPFSSLLLPHAHALYATCAHVLQCATDIPWSPRPLECLHCRFHTACILRQ